MTNTALPANQITPGATFAVRCGCGFAHDSRAETPEAAIAEIKATHDAACRDGDAWTAVAYTCSAHQSIGRCMPCERGV